MRAQSLGMLAPSGLGPLVAARPLEAGSDEALPVGERRSTFAREGHGVAGRDEDRSVEEAFFVATIRSLLRDRVSLRVRSVDRIYLQAYVPRLMSQVADSVSA
jgi:hypothetical protein